jgi:hypothetical protein
MFSRRQTIKCPNCVCVPGSNNRRQKKDQNLKSEKIATQLWYRAQRDMSAEVPTPTDALAPPAPVPACNYCRKGHTACDMYRSPPPCFTSYFGGTLT